ncbi:MAG: phosphate acyltransferase PlsX [Clostridiales Family XIII bacterium]|jgi:glycerol-3-phosphate acyltransferase PlsX|nr:phosphate acyltransferase PlsX [Clostridiales Family XIII bacterium]
MRIILDGMGGDNAPAEIVKGAAKASILIDHEICIVGDKKLIKAELNKNDYVEGNISIHHASEVITSEEKPVQAIRTKKDSSMVVGLNLVKNGEGDAFISAGNSGAIMSGGLLLLGRIKGMDRPALGAPFPDLATNRMQLLVDAGANSECKPINLVHFAIMGSTYMKEVIGEANPRVGLVNMGTEPNKGNTLLKETYPMLSRSSESGIINFIGNVEARDIPQGVCDVIVCDGMTGNVILKLTEGVALSVMGLLMSKMKSSPIALAGAALMKSKLSEIKEAFDYTEYGGAPVLGIKHPVIKIHGSSDANAVKNGILKGIPFVEKGVVGLIESAVTRLGNSAETGEAGEVAETGKTGGSTETLKTGGSAGAADTTEVPEAHENAGAIEKGEADGR